MYVMYYASMLRCWQLVRILVRTNHPYLRVGRHTYPHLREAIIDPSSRGAHPIPQCRQDRCSSPGVHEVGHHYSISLSSTTSLLSWPLLVSHHCSNHSTSHHDCLTLAEKPFFPFRSLPLKCVAIWVACWMFASHDSALHRRILVLCLIFGDNLTTWLHSHMHGRPT
jgi:hypothetical protein